MARHRAPSICAHPGCPNPSPCAAHVRQPWAGATSRRPTALTGRALQVRNARILQRDRHRCHVCGQPGADRVDHVIPLAEGGTEDDGNLAAIHDQPCHAAKSSKEAARGRARRR